MRGAMRGALTAVVLALGACSTGAGAVEPPTPGVPRINLDGWGLIEAHWTGSGPRVAVLGDSLAHMTRDELHHELDSYMRRVDAVVGEGWLPGSWSAGYERDLIEDSAVDIAGQGTDVVVWVLGTNDAANEDRPLDEVLAEIAEMADRFDHSCIVAVTVNEQSERLDQAKARAINLELARHATIIVPADPDLLEDDGVHPTVEGRAGWAAAVRAGVDDC